MVTVDYVIVCAYLVILVLVGLWLQKKASAGIDSFFLGNRSIPWWALATSGMSSNLDITGTMINSALLFALGVGGFFVEIRGGMTLVIAFLLAFMGKWNRRAKVMTLAEWMRLRFGDGRDGQVARIIAAAGTIILTTAMVTYFCKGAGKFVALFLRIPALAGLPPEFWAAIVMITLAMIYTVASGLHGVVWTDVFQSVFIFITIVAVCFLCLTRHPLPETFELSAPVNESVLREQQARGLPAGGAFEVREVKGKRYVVWQTTRAAWTSAVPRLRNSFPAFSEYSMFNLLGVLILFYLIKVALEGGGGVTGYMCQRYFAVASDREAGLMSLLWVVLLAFRWPFIAAIAIMGISLGAQQGVIGDPELVLPTVIETLIPTGLKGLLVAGLMAAAMSTFDSTVNAGAAYWVKDLYQAFINRGADQRRLLFHSRAASVAIVLAALLFSILVKNINTIWAWITMGIGAGMMVPQVIRWYWWRFNGWGFTAGTFAGIVAAVVAKAVAPVGTPEYVTFPVLVLVSLVVAVIATLATSPTDDRVLRAFYRRTRPFGLWGPVRDRLPGEVRDAINRENRRDIVSALVAVPWQVVLFLAGMMPVMRRADQLSWLLGALAVLSVLLYLSWYRHLSQEVKLDGIEGG